MHGPIWTAFTAYWRASNYSETTLCQYRQTLDRLEREGMALPPDLDLPTAQMYVRQRLTEVKASTVAVEVKALRAYSRFAADAMRTKDNLREGAGLRIPRHDDPEAQITATDADVEGLLAQCKSDTFEDIRDHALVSLFAATGARRSEVAKMTVDDVNFDGAEVHLRATKARKPRRVRMRPEAAMSLYRYMNARAKRPDAFDTDALWLGQRPGGLGVQGIGFAVWRRAKKAGLPDGFGTHAFRRKLAVSWLQKGGTEQGLKEVAGWTSTAMIGRYAKAALPDLALAEMERLFG